MKYYTLWFIDPNGAECIFVSNISGADTAQRIVDAMWSEHGLKVWFEED